jgi:hypothetical protein
MTEKKIGVIRNTDDPNLENAIRCTTQAFLDEAQVSWVRYGLPRDKTGTILASAASLCLIHAARLVADANDCDNPKSVWFIVDRIVECAKENLDREVLSHAGKGLRPN